MRAIAIFFVGNKELQGRRDERPEPTLVPIGAADVSAYHRKHAVLIFQDGDDYATVTFKGDPKTIDFSSYFGDYSPEENSSAIDVNRAQRMFGMGLMTRCR